MSKVVKLSSVMEREEKLKEIYEVLEEIKDQLTEPVSYTHLDVYKRQVLRLCLH